MKRALDPLLKMAMAHYQFEVIHPFADGNGRAGRVLNIMILVQKGLLDYPILYLSHYIINHKADYYQLLADVSQRGSWERWLLFMLEAIRVTAQLTYTKINSITDSYEAVLAYVIEKTKIRQPDQLIEAIYLQPYTKVEHLVERGLYSENTARKYLEELVKLKVLQKRVISGKHYYLNLELYGILGD